VDEAEAIGGGHKLEGLFDAAALPHQLSSISTSLTQLLSGLDDIGGRRPSSQSAAHAAQLVRQRCSVKQPLQLVAAADGLRLVHIVFRSGAAGGGDARLMDSSMSASERAFTVPS